MKCQSNICGHINGFTIVELLVSMVIAAIILSGVVQVAMSGKRSAMDGQEISFIQDNARFVLEQLKADAFAAGYRGCAGRGNTGIVNAVKDDLNGFIDIQQGIQGYEADAGIDLFPGDYKSDAKGGADSIVVRFADATHTYKVKSHDASISAFTLWTEESIEQGSTMVVTDANCRSSGLFQVTSDGTASETLSHEGDATRNCTNVLKNDGRGIVDCITCDKEVCGTLEKKSFLNAASIMPYRVYAYYLGDSDIVADMPALKRRVLITSGGVAKTSVEEIAHGVEDLQVTYGVDVDTDSVANSFVDADDVVQWDQVVSMRVRLVFRSSSPVYATNQTLTLKIDGEDVVVGNDKYLRQVVTTNVKLRNL